jgi:hypothetical protein
MKASYMELLKDPRWQKKRLSIFERDEWTCQRCFDSEYTLVVHHMIYIQDKMPWDYPDEYLITLCIDCHEEEGNVFKLMKKELMQFLASERYLSTDISELYLAVKYLAKNFRYPAEVQMGFLTWVLSNEKLMKNLSNQYWEVIHKRAEKVRAAKCSNQ